MLHNNTFLLLLTFRWRLAYCMHGDIVREIVPSFQSKLAESVEANEILEFDARSVTSQYTMIFVLIISICNKSFQFAGRML